MPSVPTPHLSFKFRTGPASAPSLAEKHQGHREAARIGTDGEAQNTWRLPCAPHQDPNAYAPVAFFMRAAFPGRQSPRRARASQDDASRKENAASLPSISVRDVLNRLPPVLAESVTYTGVFCQTTRRFCLENENLMKSHKYKSSIHLSKNGFFVGILFYRRFSLHNTEKMFICSICQKGS